MKKKQDYLKFLLPVVAVVVIIESVVVLGRLSKREKLERVEEPSQIVKEETEEAAAEPVAALSFATAEKKMEVGKEYVVEVNLTGLADISLDAIDIYVSFDPEKVAVADDLVFSSSLEEPVFAKVSLKKKVIVANFLVTEGSGFQLAEGEVVDLLKFKMTPLQAGEMSLQFATGKEDKDSVTMFVESQTGRQLPWSASKLEVKAEENK